MIAAVQPPQAAPAPPVFLSPRQAALALGLSERKLWTLTHETREIPHLKIGKSVRYRIEALQEWAAAQEKGGR